MLAGLYASAVHINLLAFNDKHLTSVVALLPDPLQAAKCLGMAQLDGPPTSGCFMNQATRLEIRTLEAVIGYSALYATCGADRISLL